MWISVRKGAKANTVDRAQMRPEKTKEEMERGTRRAGVTMDRWMMD